MSAKILSTAIVAGLFSRSALRRSRRTRRPRQLEKMKDMKWDDATKACVKK